MDGFLGDLSARSADASVSSSLPPVASLVNSVVVHCQPAGTVDAIVSPATTTTDSPSSALAAANPAGGVGVCVTAGSSAGAGVVGVGAVAGGAGAAGVSQLYQLPPPLPTSSALGVQIIALRWLKRLVELGGRSLLPLLSGVLAALLPCFALQSPATATALPLPLSPNAGGGGIGSGAGALSLLGGRESPSSITTGSIRLRGVLYVSS